jgi:hypothetical protein
MSFYIRAPLDEAGIVTTRGRMERVELRADATEVVYGDASFLEGEAYREWPEISWKIEKVGDRKYVVRSD